MKLFTTWPGAILSRSHFPGSEIYSHTQSIFHLPIHEGEKKIVEAVDSPIFIGEFKLEAPGLLEVENLGNRWKLTLPPQAILRNDGGLTSIYTNP